MTEHECAAEDAWARKGCATDANGKEGWLCGVMREFSPLGIGEQCNGYLNKAIKHEEDIPKWAWDSCNDGIIQKAHSLEVQPLTGGTDNIGRWSEQPLGEPRGCTLSDINELVNKYCGHCVPQAWLCIDPNSETGTKCARTISSEHGRDLALGDPEHLLGTPHIFDDRRACEAACTVDSFALKHSKFPFEKEYHSGIPDTLNAAMMSCVRGKNGTECSDANAPSALTSSPEPNPPEPSSSPAPTPGESPSPNSSSTQSPPPAGPPPKAYPYARSGVGCVSSSGSSNGWRYLGAAGQEDNSFPCDGSDPSGSMKPIDV